MFTQDESRAALGFVERQTSHVERAVNEELMPDIQYPSLIPVDNSANEWSSSVTYYSAAKFGQAKWINGNSDDVPIAGSELAQHEVGVHMAGIGYGYGLKEVRQALMIGRPLLAEDAKAARRAYEEMVDRVALKGDALKGFEGLISHGEVTPVAATTGGWLTGATADEMVADVNKAILGTATDTNYASVADTILLPFDRLERLGNARLDGTDKTAYEYLVRNNTYTMMTGQALTIRGVRGLETAGAGSVGRMVAYRRSPDVLKLHIPMPHRFLPVYQDGPLNYVVPGIFALAGLDLRRPKEMRYVDGV